MNLVFFFQCYFFAQQKLCIVKAVICHKRAGEDACAHLECIKRTGKCLHDAGVRLHHLPPPVVCNYFDTHNLRQRQARQVVYFFKDPKPKYNNPYH